MKALGIAGIKRRIDYHFTGLLPKLRTEFGRKAIADPILKDTFQHILDAILGVKNLQRNFNMYKDGHELRSVFLLGQEILWKHIDKSKSVGNPFFASSFAYARFSTIVTQRFEDYWQYVLLHEFTRHFLEREENKVVADEVPVCLPDPVQVIEDNSYNMVDLTLEEVNETIETLKKPLICNPPIIGLGLQLEDGSLVKAAPSDISGFPNQLQPVTNPDDKIQVTLSLTRLRQIVREEAERGFFVALTYMETQEDHVNGKSTEAMDTYGKRREKSFEVPRVSGVTVKYNS